MKKDPDKRALWEKRIAEYRSSGLSGLQWCKKNTHAYSTFKYWLAKIVRAPSRRLLKSPITQNSFTELKDFSSYDTTGVEIVIGRATIRLHKGFNEMVLKSCLCVLGG